MGWIIPFQGRKKTGVYGQNVLWKSGNVYVMDNHRAAAWCWANEVNDAEDHALIHIDRHYDALESQLTAWLAALPNGLKLPIADYLNADYTTDLGSKAPVIRWDNYLPIYVHAASGRVSPIIVSTHRDGDRPKTFDVQEVEPWDLLENLEYDVSQLNCTAILNVDLDFFFCDGDSGPVRLYSDDYFDEFCGIISRLNKSGKISVITIALTATDDLTGGWPEVERLASRMCSALGHSFALP